jgi:hypothetical protein
MAARHADRGYSWPMPVDDTALRTAAMQLLRDARQHVPGVAFTAHAVERGNGAVFVVEVIVGRHGPERTAILLDMGGPEQQVLAQFDGVAEIAAS